MKILGNKKGIEYDESYKPLYKFVLYLARSDRFMMYDEALNVFGNEDNLNMWLQMPNESLNGRSPEDVLDEPYGLETVLMLILRIEWGIPD
jgi:uncharacterized protein (DUF2384 family)